MIADTGSVFYQDEYQTIYDVAWETINDKLDITTIVSQPYVYGQEPQGYVQNHKLFKLGTITVTRQIIRVFDGGYEIVAEGTSQYFDYIQVNFICEEIPYDNFTYHINCGISDEIEGLVSDGSQWTDPDEVTSDCVWCDLQSDGTPIVGTDQVLEWLDVWPDLTF